MNLNVTQKLIQSHLLHGDMKRGEEIGIRIDQTLTQDAELFGTPIRQGLLTAETAILGGRHGGPAALS